MQYILMPFSWLLLFFYHVLNSYGLALILFAIVIKVILFPVTLKSKKSMIQTTMLSGKMQQLQKQYGKDRERYNLEVQKLYEREKVNPMGGCLWSLIPVSYTHLDVYKRQASSWGRISLGCAMGSVTVDTVS